MLGDKSNAIAHLATKKTKVATVVEQKVTVKPTAVRPVTKPLVGTTKTRVPSRSSIAKPITKPLVKPTITKPAIPVIKEEPAPIKEEALPTSSLLKSGEEGWQDLDAEDAEDPLMVSDYVNDIFGYMKSIEGKSMPNPNYMEKQGDIKWSMRAILVDWLIEVHAKFYLLPETLFLAINIVDRFLSLRVVSLIKLQLVGITAMFIAAKYEEIMAPSVEAFIYMSDGGYSEAEVLKAERYMLGVLEFNLGYPNPLNFLRRISKADDYDLATRTVAKYLMEVPMLDHRFLEYPPSQIAAAAMWLSRRMLGRGEWTPNLVHYSGYSQDELMPVVHLMHDYIKQKEIKYEAVYKKYAHKKYMKASIFCRSWAEKRPTLDI